MLRIFCFISVSGNLKDQLWILGGSLCSLGVGNLQGGRESGCYSNVDADRRDPGQQCVDRIPEHGVGPS